MAGVNRLLELRGENAANFVEERTTDVEIAKHMELYLPIKQGLNLIRDNIIEVNKLKNKNTHSASEKSRKEILQELDKVMGETTAKGTQIKKALNEIKENNAKYSAEHADSAKSQMRANLYQTHLRRFHQVMNDYNSSSHDFKKSLKEWTRRQLKIVTTDRDISDEDIEKIVESGKANEVIRQALISENLENVIEDIEQRHLGVLKLEKQVLEVYELFRDLATLVDIQQESFDVIENRIINAKQYTQDGEDELGQAEIYQKKARQRKLCVYATLAVIFAVLITVIYSETA